MLESELKRKLRSLKRLEKRMRYQYLRRYPDTDLVWNSYFSTRSWTSNAKYPLETLLESDRVQRKQVFEEYLYSVFVQHSKEEGFSITIFHDPEILSFLELPPYATFTDIKTRFRQLAHRYHPDKGGDPEQMIQLLEIYEKHFPKTR
jgi:hypothetical protein